MPRTLGFPPLNRWERVVYDRLRAQLPAEWVVIANVGWSRRTGSGPVPFVRDGQADFVVLVPHLGMVVLEVKGSREFRVASDGRWYRLDAHTREETQLDETPADQATRNMYELRDVVCASLQVPVFPGLYAYVVLYPQGRLAEELPVLYDRSTLATAADLTRLEAVLRGALLARGERDRGEAFTRDVLDRAARILTSQSLRIVKSDLEEDRGSSSERIELLTRQQFAALKGLFEHPRVAVIGPAGSGKTVLAVWLLKGLLETGARVLYTCYNKTLAKALQLRDESCAASIMHVDQYFMGIMAQAGVDTHAELARCGADKFFSERLPELVLDVVAGGSRVERLDAVIIDEGQDFSDVQLIALLELLQKDGRYTIFADRRQDLFGVGAAGTVGAEILFALYHNCRNTEKTNAAANRLTAGEIPSMPGVPVGNVPVVKACTNVQSVITEAWRLAKEWSVEGAKVAILSPFQLRNSSLAGQPVGHGMRLVSDLLAWKAGESIYFSTIRSFKGLEADAVILIDIVEPTPGSVFASEDLYVALTRSTGRLGILCRTPAAFDWVEQALRGIDTAR